MRVTDILTICPCTKSAGAVERKDRACRIGGCSYFARTTGLCTQCGFTGGSNLDISSRESANRHCLGLINVCDVTGHWLCMHGTVRYNARIMRRLSGLSREKNKVRLNCWGLDVCIIRGVAEMLLTSIYLPQQTFPRPFCLPFSCSLLQDDHALHFRSYLKFLCIVSCRCRIFILAFLPQPRHVARYRQPKCYRARGASCFASGLIHDDCPGSAAVFLERGGLSTLCGVSDGALGSWDS